MLKYNEVNPLNVHGLRQMRHCPPHFKPLTIDMVDAGFHRKKTLKSIVDWVYEHLGGRFYVSGKLTDTVQTSRDFTIAFEEESELSFFILSMPTFIKS